MAAAVSGDGLASSMLLSAVAGLRLRIHRSPPVSVVAWVPSSLLPSSLLLLSLCCSLCGSAARTMETRDDANATAQRGSAEASTKDNASRDGAERTAHKPSGFEQSRFDQAQALRSNTLVERHGAIIRMTVRSTCSSMPILMSHRLALWLVLGLFFACSSSITVRPFA